MTAVIPPLFGQWTGVFTLAALPRPLQITCGYQPSVALTAAQQNQAIRTAFTGPSRPAAAASMFVGYNFVESKVLFRNGGGLLIADSDVTPVIGIKSGDGCPANTSVIVRKPTAFAGKKYRGRMLTPPMFVPESSVTQNGIISASLVTSLTAMYQDWQTACSAAGITLVLLHSDATAPTAIAPLTVNNKIGTIGKRLRP